MYKIRTQVHNTEDQTIPPSQSTMYKACVSSLAKVQLFTKSCDLPPAFMTLLIVYCHAQQW